MAGAVTLDAMYDLYKIVAANIAKNMMVLQFNADLQSTQLRELVSSMQWQRYTITLLYCIDHTSLCCVRAVCAPTLHTVIRYKQRIDIEPLCQRFLATVRSTVYM
jgi:hypothetical protein